MQDAVLALLSGDNFAQLATVNPDNMPHVDTVWLSHADNHITVATTSATLKARNLQTNPNAYMVVTNRHNPYEQAQIKLTLASIADDESMEICDDIAMSYTGKAFPQRKHRGRIALSFSIEKIKYHIARV